jgi:aspartyl-tRNA(Asn)/glutamyl-tRNA(Gln) amidotransferase subunit C
MAIERKTVEHVAKLARLELSEADLAKYGSQLGAILDYIQKLEGLDVAGLEPFAHPAESADVFRDDAPKPSIPRDAALANAPEKTAEFFIVPKVVE